MVRVRIRVGRTPKVRVRARNTLALRVGQPLHNLLAILAPFIPIRVLDHMCPGLLYGSSGLLPRMRSLHLGPEVG